MAEWLSDCAQLWPESAISWYSRKNHLRNNLSGHYGKMKFLQFVTDLRLYMAFASQMLGHRNVVFRARTVPGSEVASGPRREKGKVP